MACWIEVDAKVLGSGLHLSLSCTESEDLRLREIKVRNIKIDVQLLWS